MSARARDAGRLIRLAVLSATALVMVSPYLWMLSVASKPRDEIFSATLHLLPDHWALLDNLREAFHRVPIGTLLFNGALVCGVILAIQVAVAIPCAYAMAKLRFGAARLMMGLVLLGLLVPIHATALPLYVVFRRLDLVNTYTGLVAPFSISVFGIFLFLQFFRTLPDDLLDAARLDGMSEAGIVARVVVPNSWPAVTAFAVFSVVAHWNDLFWPLIVVTDNRVATPPLGLFAFRAAESGSDYGALMAATLVITLPLVVAFLLAQRRFVEGITLTGLK